MLGVKTCRAVRTCCAGRALALSASQSVRGPGPARRYGMQGLARWLHAWRWRMWQCLVWPPTRGGTLLWHHMHKVYSVWSYRLFRCWWEALRRPAMCKTCFLEQLLGSFRACQSQMHAMRASVKRSVNKVKLNSASSIAFERSSHSNDQRAPKIEQNSIWKPLQTTIF